MNEKWRPFMLSTTTFNIAIFPFVMVLFAACTLIAIFLTTLLLIYFTAYTDKTQISE